MAADWPRADVGGDGAPNVSPRLTNAEKALRALSERDFQRGYVAALRSIGFRVGHHYDSRFSDPGTKGQPDLLIVGHGVCWFVELKRETGVVHPEQAAWMFDLNQASQSVWIYRPSDWDEMIEQAEAQAKQAVPAELRVIPQARPKKKKRAVPPRT